MIYWYTGQPGHGKTLHALDRAIDYREQGRLVYVCNVTEFDHAKAGMLPMTPEQFRDWPNFLPDGAVCLVDEAYEHEMLPKRAPGSRVPVHVQQLAKHRHRGIDFIFVCQSPARQCDDFTHDLMDEHIHVRRRFGTRFVHLRVFDKYERNPDKGFPLVVRRVTLPKRPRGLYKSTVLDTTERRIPWYYIAAAVLLPAVIFGAFYMTGHVGAQLSGQGGTKVLPAGVSKVAGEDGALATAEPAAAAKPESNLRKTDYVAWLTPRVPSQPWTAPAYDGLSTPPQPPRVFCMASGEDGDEACSCITEQGTRYYMELRTCRLIAKDGQYEPFRDEVEGDRRRLDSVTQQRQLADAYVSQRGDFQTMAPIGAAPSPGVVIAGGQVSGYGGIAVTQEPGSASR